MACAPALAQVELDRAYFIQLSASVVKVEASNTSGGFSLGTAVAVAPGTVVTNCHVTRDAQSIALVKGGVRWTVESQFADLRHDLCLLKAPGMEVTPVGIRSANQLRVGERVGALGFAGGTQMTLRDGVVRALNRLDGSNVIQSSTAFTSGASGGGLFDQQGRLVGILTFRLRGAYGHYFSTPVDWVEAAIAKAEDFTAVAPFADWTPFWQESANRLPYFMQAAQLEVDDNWEELLRLADDWAASDSATAEPWLSRGRAYSHLDRTGAAVRAFEKAVALQPGSAEAWFNLGVAYFRLGDGDAVQRVLARLGDLDPELADDLAVVSGRTRN